MAQRYRVVWRLGRTDRFGVDFSGEYLRDSRPRYPLYGLETK